MSASDPRRIVPTWQARSTHGSGAEGWNAQPTDRRDDRSRATATAWRRSCKVSKAIAKLAGIVFLSLTLGAPALAQQAPDNIGGDWTIYATNIDNGEAVVKHVQITQSGNQLSGYFEGPNQSGPIHGESQRAALTFSTVTRNVVTNFGDTFMATPCQADMVSMVSMRNGRPARERSQTHQPQERYTASQPVIHWRQRPYPAPNPYQYAAPSATAS